QRCSGASRSTAKSSTTFSTQTITVASTSVQKPSIEKPPTITSVSQSISIATPNQASPSVRIASGKVSSLRIGLTSVLGTPQTAAANTTVQKEPLKLTPLSTQPTNASTSAFQTQETRMRATNGTPRSYAVARQGRYERGVLPRSASRSATSAPCSGRAGADA